jgi:hypothetical protein
MRTLLQKLREVLKLFVTTQRKRTSFGYNVQQPSDNGEEKWQTEAAAMAANLTKMESLLGIFAHLSRGRWVVKQPETPGMVVTWSVGQPLGLYPSFGVFALTHGLLLNSISKEHDLQDGELHFRVLGDDVVIDHPEVANSYLRYIKQMGIEVSPAKTIVSNRVGEFAGKVIGPQGALRVYKFLPSTAGNPAGPLLSLGWRGISLVIPRYRRLVSDFACLPEPEGLGLNPKGIPLKDRLTDDFVRSFFRGKPPKAVSDTVVKSDRHWYNVSFWSRLIDQPGELRNNDSCYDEEPWSLRGLRSFWKRLGSRDVVVDHINKRNHDNWLSGDEYISLPKTEGRAPRGRPHSDEWSEDQKGISLRKMRKVVRQFRKLGANKDKTKS